MFVNHVKNASKRLTLGLKIDKGIPACFRILFHSSQVSESLLECRRLLTGTGGVLPMSRLLASSNHSSTVSGQMLTSEGSHQQTFRCLTVDQNPLTCVTRSVMFDDIQMYKIVHGGVYLSMTEEAGEIAVKKFCSETQIPQYLTAVPTLTRIEKTLFLGSATLGDILEAEAEIIYAAPHSLKVLVCLYAAPIIKSQNRIAISRSWVWYELQKGEKSTEVLPVPPFETKNAMLEEEGRLERETIMADKQKRPTVNTLSKLEYSGLNSVTSTQILYHSSGRASPVLKWMDELSGLTAHHFVQVKCVTGSCDDVNIYSRLVPGSYVTVTTAVAFTSSRTVDVQTFADVETIQDGSTTKERAAEAFFTFVVLSKSSNPIRQFTPQTEFEKETYEKRMKVYQKRKQSSKAANSG